MTDRQVLKDRIRAYFDGPAGFGIPNQVREHFAADLTVEISALIEGSDPPGGPRDERAPAPAANKMRRPARGKAE